MLYFWLNLKPNKMRLFTFISIILILTSCTVEKRLYNRGWHVEWKHRNSITEHNPSSGETLNQQEDLTKTVQATTATTITEPTDVEVISGIRPEETTPELAETIHTDHPENEEPVISSTASDGSLFSSIKNEVRSYDGENRPSKKVNWKEMDSPIKAMWIMNLLYGIGLPVLFAIGIATSHTVAEVAVGLSLFFFLIVLLTTLILYTAALRRKKQFPERYNEFTIHRAVIGGVLLSVGSVVIMFIAGIYILLADATSHW